MDELSGATVSQPAGDAPPADAPAATSTTAPAADSTSAAAPSAPEAAASTETGAQPPATDATNLDDVYAKYEQRIADESAAEAAPPSDKTDQPAKAAEPKEPGGEEQQAGTEEQEAPAEEADPFAEFEPKPIPTRAEIDRDFARAPKGVRDLAAELGERAAQSEQKLSQIGGEEEVKTAQAITPLLFSTDISDQTGDALFDKLTEANPDLIAHMGGQFIAAALDDPRTGAAFGDQLLESNFGEGYTKARLDELVELDKAGLIDTEALKEDLGSVRQPTARERELETANTELQRQVKELTGQGDDAARIAEQRLADQLDSFVTDRALAVITPIAEKFGWTALEGEEGPLAASKKLHGEMVTAWLDSKIKSSPHYATMKALQEKGNAFKGGEPTRQMRAAVERLENFARATFTQAVRTQQPTYAKSFAPSRPATTTAGRSGDANQPRATPPTPAPQTPKPEMSAREQLDALWAKGEAAQRDAGAYPRQR